MLRVAKLVDGRVNSKFVRSFLDIIVMAILDDAPSHGYDIIATIHKEFGVLLSPGTIYPLLYSLKSNGSIESSNIGSKILYRISPKGKQKYASAVSSFRSITENMSNLVKKQDSIILKV